VSAVEKIEQEIELLSSGDFARLAAWMDHRRNEKWDQQMDEDSSTGRLDFLFEEAEAERRSNKLQDWPRLP
jgi:hypothetical protein